MKAKKTKATAKFEAEKSNENAIIEGKIARAIELSEAMKSLKSELEDLKSEFLGIFGEGRSEKRIVTSAGAVVLKETNSYSVEAEWVPDLKKVFKGDFSAYVTEKTTYGATAALRAKLSDGDYKHSKLIREAVVITTRNSVEFEAVKPATAKLSKSKSA